LRVSNNDRVRKVEIAADGDGLVSRSGTALTDRLSLARAVSGPWPIRASAVAGTSRGRILRDLALRLADGGDCVSALGALRHQPELCGARSPRRNGMKGDRAGVRPPRRPGRVARAGTGGAWAAGGAPSELVLDFDSHLVGEAGRHRPGSAALASIPCSATSTRPARCGERVSTGQATGGRPSELERPKAVSSSNREQSGRLSVWSGGTALPVPDPGGTLSGVRSQPRRGLRYGTALTGSLTSGRDAGPEEDR